MSAPIRDLGELATKAGFPATHDFTVYRDNVVWDLTSYTVNDLRVWDLRTNTVVALTGTLAALDAANGIVQYTLGTSDPIDDTTGVFEARVYATIGGNKVASDLFRYAIAGGPPPS